MESLVHLTDCVEVKVNSVAQELEDLDRTVRKRFKDHDDRLQMYGEDIAVLKTDLLGVLGQVDEKCHAVTKNRLVQQENSRKDSKSIEDLYEGVIHDVAKQNESVTRVEMDIHTLQVGMQGVQVAIDQLGKQSCPSSMLCDQLLCRLDEVIEDQRAFREFVHLQLRSPSCNETEGRIPTLGDEIGPFSTPTRLPSGLCFLTPGLIALANASDLEPAFTSESDVFSSGETPRAIQRNLARDFSLQAHSLGGSGEESSALSPVTQHTQLVYTVQDVEDHLSTDSLGRNLSMTSLPKSEISPTCAPSFEVCTIGSYTNGTKSIRSEEIQTHTSSPLFKLMKLDEDFDLHFKPLPPIPGDKPHLLDLLDLDDANKKMAPPLFDLSDFAPFSRKILDWVEQFRFPIFQIVQRNWLRTTPMYRLHIITVFSILVAAMVGHSIHRKGVNLGVNQRADSHFWSPGEGYAIQPLEGL